MPEELLLLETDCPYLSPSRTAERPTAPTRARDAARGRRAARHRRRGAGRAVTPTPPAPSAAVNAPRQLTLARLAELGLRPDRELGQHFLVDDNLLGVIGRLRRSRRTTSRSRSAPAWACSRPASPSCSHTCTRSRSTAGSSRRCCARSRARQRQLHWGDAMRLDLAALAPAPTAFVANLPYHVAAPLVLDSIAGLPGIAALVRAWCSARSPSGSAPGRATRSTAGRACSSASRSRRPAATPSRAASSRRCPTSTPRSWRSRAGRAWPELAADWPAIVATVHAAFAHRRKTLANALALAGWRADRAAVEAACAPPASIPGARAEALPPETLRRPRADGRVDVLAGSRSISACASARAARTATTSWRPCSPAPARRRAGARACRDHARRGAGPGRRRHARDARADLLAAARATRAAGESASTSASRSARDWAGAAPTPARRCGWPTPRCPRR